MRRWVKLHTEIIDDPKMALLSDKEFRALINLFALAGQVDDDGILGTKEEIAYRLRMPPSKLARILSGLCQKGVRFGSKPSEKLQLAAFMLRNSTPPSAKDEAVAARVKKSRAYKQGKTEARNDVTPSLHLKSNEPVTTLEENREDKNREEGTGADAPRATLPEDLLLIDLTPSGRILLGKYDQLAARAGKTSRVKRYKNDQQRRAFEAVYRVLNGELETLIDKGFAHDRTRVTDMLSWLEGCVKRKGEEAVKAPQILPRRNMRGPNE